MKEQDIIANDVLVVQDGENPSFFSYTVEEETQRITQCGLQNAGRIHLRETPERRIPQSLKDGQSEITDIQVKLAPNVIVYLN